MSDSPVDPIIDLIEAYLLGTCTREEAAAVKRRAAADPRFAHELESLREALATFALGTPSRPDPELKERVLARIATSGRHADHGEESPDLRRRRRQVRTSLWLGAALAASLALVLKLSFDLQRERRAMERATAQLARQTATVAARDSTIAKLANPEMELVTLTASGSSRPMLRAFIDHVHHTMTLAASGLAPMPTGKAYQLWFMMDGKAMPSVTFRPAPDGSSMVTDIPMPTGAIAAATVTAEPESGSATPTSTVLFEGRLASR